MRHRMKGRKLGRNASHRKAMFRNMACSLIRSVRIDEDDPSRPKVAGRIITTLPKAKELRPIVEKLVTLARKAAVHQSRADEYATSAERDSDAWRSWRESPRWNEWNQAIAPALAYRRRAFARLRDNEVIDILFNELAERFADRPGGYTRVIRLATVRLGDAGKQALIEFVGERDRITTRKRQAPTVVVDEQLTFETPAGDANDAGDVSAAVADEDAAAESIESVSATDVEATETADSTEGDPVAGSKPTAGSEEEKS